MKAQQSQYLIVDTSKDQQQKSTSSKPQQVKAEGNKEITDSLFPNSF
jgi:hypothetical protein